MQVALVAQCDKLASINLTSIGGKLNQLKLAKPSDSACGHIIHVVLGEQGDTMIAS